jgi:small-conductance mechanosensitive channel
MITREQKIRWTTCSIAFIVVFIGFTFNIQIIGTIAVGIGILGLIAAIFT